MKIFYNYNLKKNKYKNIEDKNCKYKFIFFSFKNINNWNDMIFKITFKLKKFSVLKAPFKYNKTREQYCLKKYINILYLSNYSPKIYEILFFQYLFLSNTKFFNVIKIENNFI